MKPRSGTKEWSDHSKNIQIGCSNGCIYGYCLANALRYKLVKDYDEWVNHPRPNKKVNEKPRKLKGRIMMPTTHDITKDNVEECEKYLIRWLQAGNEFLIVSKPDPDVIARLCISLNPWRDKITWRFTIGSSNNDVLRFWEPNAPDFEERKEALQIAHDMHYRTSVSCEPYLDGGIITLVEELLPWVTDTIWIGKLNKLDSRVNTKDWSEKDHEFLYKVVRSQTDDMVRGIVSYFALEPKIRWKDSIKSIMGMDEEEVG